MGGFKVWAVGEEVLAADFNAYIQQQVVAMFATAAARTAGIAAPVAGQPSYIDSGDAAEGLEFWNGASWRKPWNMPWGEIAAAEVTANQAAFGPAAGDITGLVVNFTAVAGRIYEIVGFANLQSSAAQSVSLLLTDAANAGVQAATVYVAAATVMNTSLIRRLVGLTAGAKTYKLRAQCATGTIAPIALASQPNYIRVHDVGPAGAPT